MLNLSSSSIVGRELELLVVVALLTESVVVTFLVVEARDQWICLRGMEMKRSGSPYGSSPAWALNLTVFLGETRVLSVSHGMKISVVVRDDQV